MRLTFARRSNGQRTWLLALPVVSSLFLAAGGDAFGQACEKYEHDANRCVSRLRQYELRRLFWFSESVGTTFELANNCKHDVSVTAVFGDARKRLVIPAVEEKSTDAEDASEPKRVSKGMVVCDKANCGKIDRIVSCSAVPAQLLEASPSSEPRPTPVGAPIVASTDPKIEVVPVKIDRFVGRQNADLTGLDIKSMTAQNANECADSCARDSACIGYTFDRWNKRCFLKGTIASVRLEPKGYSAWKDGQGPAPSSSQRVIETYRGRKLSGTPLDTKASDSSNACVVSCRDHDQCVGMQFSKAGQCVRFSQVDGYNPGAEEGLVSGVKRQLE